MLQATQLDEACDSQGDTLPLASGPPSKKQKVEERVPGDQRDMIKWLPYEGDIIPFVKKWGTNVVYCGQSKMEVFKVGGVTCVDCLQGCSTECGQAAGCPAECLQAAECACFCHVLRKDYNDRHATDLRVGGD